MGRCSRSMVFGALLLMSCATWASATDHIVGGSSGWTLNFNYSAWAAGESFVVGDTLVFRYVASQHNVEEVSSTDYNDCSSSNPIFRDNGDGSRNVTLSASGKRYFICGVGDHCNRGMKVEVDVAAAGSTPSSPPPPPSSSTTPPAPSAAASLSPAHAIAALLVGFLGMKLALF